MLSIITLLYAETMKHEESRRRVCLACFKKVKETECLDSMSVSLQQRLQRLAPSLDRTDDRVPLGLCLSCRAKMKRVEERVEEGSKNGSSTFELVKLTAFLGSQPRSSPRKDCCCTICKTASASGLHSRKSVNQKKQCCCHLLYISCI